MKLTNKNYHSESNRNLTTSKLKDLLLDKNYFYRKHILHEIEPEKTDAMTIGSMVDTALSEGVEKMNSLYIPVARRSKSEPGSKVTEVTQAMYDEAIGLIQAVMATSAWKKISTFRKQVVLCMPIPENKYFDNQYVGMLDFLKVMERENQAIIVDLKTSRTVNDKKYGYLAEELGYWYQAAAYTMLVKKNYGVENVYFYHLAVEKDPKGIHKVKTFLFDQAGIKHYTSILIAKINEIITTENWDKEDCSMDDAVILKAFDGVAESMTEAEWES
jgi:hypothetical protein